MADVGPKIEVEALGNDFAAAKLDNPRLRCSLALAFDHLLESLQALGARAFSRLRHHRIVAPISEEFLAVRPGVSSHAEHARTDSSADSNPLAASDADD